jgi:type VI secretion system protein VasI
MFNNMKIIIGFISLLALNGCAGFSEARHAYEREMSCLAAGGDYNLCQTPKDYKKQKNEVIKKSLFKGVGEWKRDVSIDPMTDAEIIYIWQYAQSGANRYGEKPILSIRCKAHSTSVHINWETFINNEPVIVHTRVDGIHSPATAWDISRTNKSTFHPYPTRFLNRLKSSSKLIARVSPYSASPVTAIFDTSGLVNAMGSYGKQCGW